MEKLFLPAFLWGPVNTELILSFELKRFEKGTA